MARASSEGPTKASHASSSLATEDGPLLCDNPMTNHRKKEGGKRCPRNIRELAEMGRLQAIDNVVSFFLLLLLFFDVSNCKH